MRDLIGKWAGEEAHTLPGFQCRKKAGDDVAVAPRKQGPHGCLGHGLGAAGRRAHQSLDARCPIDRRPMVAMAIETDKNIAWKQADQDVIDPPRVAACLSELRAEADKTLPLKVALSDEFSAW